MSVCLDSWAVLAWLDGEEPALSRVNDLIGSRPVIRACLVSHDSQSTIEARTMPPR